MPSESHKTLCTSPSVFRGKAQAEGSGHPGVEHSLYKVMSREEQEDARLDSQLRALALAISAEGSVYAAQ